MPYAIELQYSIINDKGTLYLFYLLFCSTITLVKGKDRLQLKILVTLQRGEQQGSVCNFIKFNDSFLVKFCACFIGICSVAPWATMCLLLGNLFSLFDRSQAK